MPIVRAGTALILTLCCVLLTGAAPAAASGKPPQLNIYFVDVEGGQATLIVSPDRHSLLVDSGWAGAGVDYMPGDPRQARDANRILAAARDAGLARIDAALITHFHVDHMGGIGELSRLIPIGTFIDHGSPAATQLESDPETRNAFTVYSSLRGGRTHLQPAPGDRLPLPGLDVTIVSTDRKTIRAPLSTPSQANSACSGPAVPAQDLEENPRSTGFLLRYGRFRFLDLGDLSGEPLRRLVCPKALLGPVDVYLVAHHGGGDNWDPALYSGFRPRVVILNNGVSKGGARETFETLHHVKGLEDAWQLHLSSHAGESNFAPEYVANLDENTAFWLKLSASADGSFEVINGRTGTGKRYAPAHAGTPSSGKAAERGSPIDLTH